MKQSIGNNGQKFFGRRKVTQTRIFSCYSLKLEKVNYISSLKSDDGVVVSNHEDEDLYRLLKNYYTNVLTATCDIGIYPHNENEGGISQAQNDMLTMDLSFEEFTDTVKSMPMIKLADRTTSTLHFFNISGVCFVRIFLNAVMTGFWLQIFS